MIEVAHDNLGKAIVPTPEAAVVPDAARTQEVVQVYGNVEVHAQVQPRVVTPVYGADYADTAVSTLEPRDDLGALNPPGADGFQSFAPPDSMTDSIETKHDEPLAEGQVLETPVAAEAAPMTDAHAATGAEADVADETRPTSDMGEDIAAEAPTNAAPRNLSVKASGPAHGGLGVDWKSVPVVPADQAPEGAAEERLVSPTGVDLTRLTHFNEERSSRPPKPAKKPRRPEGERQAPRPAAVQKPALLRSEKSQSYLRDALGLAQEDNDGVHHINTSAMAVTKLGKALSMNAHVPFNHPDLGPFKSVGGLWYFVGMDGPRDDTFRTLFGGACRQRGAKINMREVKGFRTIIADATWIKVNSDEHLVKAMIENELPYRCYFTVGDMDMRQSPPMADWYMPVLEEIGRTLRAIHVGGDATAVPDFEFLERRHQPRPQGRPQGRGDNNRNDRNQGQRQGQDRRVR